MPHDREVILSDAQVRDMAHAGTIYIEMTDDRYGTTGRFRITDTHVYENGSYDLHLEPNDLTMSTDTQPCSCYSVPGDDRHCEVHRSNG